MNPKKRFKFNTIKEFYRIRQVVAMLDVPRPLFDIGRANFPCSIPREQTAGNVFTIEAITCSAHESKDCFMSAA